MANRLAAASSPYLRQHADNPVDWFEWGEEAFAKAREEDKPIFLSVGYSACHWCHVMAHESFEDEATARLLNERFVPVKVDREERPDVDGVYMAAVQAMTGQGGWPMSVFTTPDGTPFFAGTYFPKDERPGMPSFTRVLEAVHTSWTTDREKVLEGGEALVQHLRHMTTVTDAGGFDARTLDIAAARAVQMWDRELGGFGGAPKFPQPMLIDFLLAHHRRTGDEEARDAALHTLDAMAAGGIRDHVDGGFARYATDARWLVPHFEKMLYDNALLLRAYVHGWQVSGSPRLRRVAVDVADYLLADLRQPEGGFSSATDADAEGVEGKHVVWTAEEFDEVVAATGEDPAVWRTFFGVTDEGNWRDPHGHAPPRANILHEAGWPGWARGDARPRDEEDAGFARRFAAVRKALAERRAQRVPPGLDDKVLTSWNALAVAALAEAGAALGEPRYVDAAIACVRFIESTLVVDGVLHHSWSPGHAPTIGAFAEDVALLARALLVLYEADPDPRWVAWARELAADADARFGDGNGLYFTTPSDGEALLLRTAEAFDNPTPSATSAMVEVHTRLAALTGDQAHRRRAERTLGRLGDRLGKAPTGFGEVLTGAERLLSGPLEVALVGSDVAHLAAVVRETWRPGVVLAAADPADAAHAATVPLLADRPLVDGQPAAYVCRDFVCERPATDPDELRALLG